MDWITSGLAPLYTIGVKLYNYMLGFSLGFGLNTPQGASSTAWAYVSGTLFPFFQAIAATMLNLFFYLSPRDWSIVVVIYTYIILIGE